MRVSLYIRPVKQTVCVDDRLVWMINEQRPHLVRIIRGIAAKMRYNEIRTAASLGKVVS